MKTQITLEQFRRWLLVYATEIAAAEARLTELDAAIGDGDHGTNMQRGMTRVRSRLEADATARLAGASNPSTEGASAQGASAQDVSAQMEDIGGLLRNVAMTLISSVGGAAGPLYGAFFLWAAKSAGPERTVDLARLSGMLRMGLEGVQQRGKAQPGEKTMLDVLSPAIVALETATRAEQTRQEAFAAMVAAGEAGMQRTIELQATKGRASYLGPRSIGHMDPGAASAFLLVQTAAATLGHEDADAAADMRADATGADVTGADVTKDVAEANPR